MSRLEWEVSSLSPLVNEIKDTLMSELLDTLERVKNELRLRTDKKLEVITEDANTLKDRLATLESGGITRKESMKSELAEQIRPLRKRITDLEAENKTIRAELTQLKMKLATVAKDTTATTASNAPVSSQSTITIAPQEPLPLIFPPLPVYLISSSTHSDDWTHPPIPPPPSSTTSPSGTGKTSEQISILSQRHSPAEENKTQRTKNRYWNNGNTSWGLCYPRY